MPLTPLETLVLLFCAVIGGLSFLHLIAISVRNEVFVHTRRIEVNSLLRDFQHQISEMYDVALAEEDGYEIIPEPGDDPGDKKSDEAAKNAIEQQAAESEAQPDLAPANDPVAQAA